MAICLYNRNRWKVIMMMAMCCCGSLWVLMLTLGLACCAPPHQHNIDHIEEGRSQALPKANLQGPPESVLGTKYRFLHHQNTDVLRKRQLQDYADEYDYEEANSKTSYQNPVNGHLGTVNDAIVQHVEHVRGSDRTKAIYKDNSNPTRENTPRNIGHISQNTNHDRTSDDKIVPYPNKADTSDGTKKLPQAIIIGVKKGGTRALLEFLRIHPDVKAPGPETHFFDRHYDKGLEWYRQQMPETVAGQLTVEKTPSYLITKEVPRRVYSMSRDTRLVLVLRDPVTRAISDYTQAASKRPGMKPFEQMAFLSNYTGLVNTSWGAIRIGVYAKHVERWLKYFPLRQMHFVNGEKLITDPAGEIAKVQDFLGLKRVINENHFVFNVTKGFPCLKKTVTSSKPHCLGKSKGRHHPTVSSLVLERLRDFFRPFNEKLYHMVGQNFNWP